MKDSRLRLSQVISLFSWLGFSFPLSFPSLPSAPLLRGVTAKFLLLMRHSWAHGPKDIHAGNELENTWPPVSFPQDNLPFPALLEVLPFLFQWPSYQSSRKKKKPLFQVAQWFLLIFFKHSPHTTAKGGMWSDRRGMSGELTGSDLLFSAEVSLILHVTGLENRESIKERDYVLRKVSRGQ